MIWHYYYRTNRADILAARKADMQGNHYVEGRGQAFADKFGGTALFTRGFTPHFAGITFTGEQRPADPELWTKRSEQQVLMRPKEKGLAAKYLQRSWALRRQWNEALAEITDIMKPRESGVLALLGITPDMVTGEHSLTYFDRGEYAYIISTLPIDGVEEILASVLIPASQLPPNELLQGAANG